MTETFERRIATPASVTDRQRQLIDVLRSRSESSKNFLHEGSAKEQVVFAAIAELRALQDKFEFLQMKLKYLQEKAKNASSPVSSGSGDQSDSSSRTQSPLTLNSVSEPQYLFDPQSESPTPSGSCNELAVSVPNPSNPFTRPLIMPIYRNFFYGADLPQAVFTPSFHFADCNQAFLDSFSLPVIMYGPITRRQFLSLSMTLLDFKTDPKDIPAIFTAMAQLMEVGQLHQDNIRRDYSHLPPLFTDYSMFATFDDSTRPSGSKRLRYVTLVRRGIRVDPSVTVEDLRRVLIGQPHPLPLPPPPPVRT